MGGVAVTAAVDQADGVVALAPNERVTAATTAGISRNMNALDPLPAGGGNLNGTASTAILHGQSGTGAGSGQVPRQNGGNYTGIT